MRTLSSRRFGSVLARGLWQVAKKADHASDSASFISLSYIKTRHYQLAVRGMNRPVIAMKSVLRIDGARPRIYIPRVFRMDVVHIRFEIIDTGDINRRIDEPYFG